jgi:hypothetical protein
VVGGAVIRGSVVRDAVPGQERAQEAGPPGQGYPQAVLAGRRDSPRDDLVRPVVAAHGIHGDQHVLARGGPVAGPRRVARGPLILGGP